MFSQGVLSHELIKSRIAEYNTKVKEGKQYMLRRFIRTTPTIFYDDHWLSLPKLRWSPVDWCKITPDLANVLEGALNTEHIVSFRTDNPDSLLQDHGLIKQCKSSIPEILTKLGKLYIGMHKELAMTYSEEKQERAINTINALTKEITENPHSIIDQPSMITYIRKRIKNAIKRNPEDSIENQVIVPHETTPAKVLRLKSKGNLTISNICHLCKISKSTYYAILKRSRAPPGLISRPPGRPLTESSLQDAELKHIEEMIESPEKSYHVPEITASIEHKFRHVVSRHKVYYAIKRKLGCTYKRNHFKPPSAFEPHQAILRYMVCQKLIEYLWQEKTLIVMDETGFDLGVQREYSYSKRGKAPFRKNRISIVKRHVMMAITNRGLFCYNVRSKGNNEHSFNAFMIDLTRKIASQLPANIPNFVVFCDSAPFHVSGLAKQLLSILPFPIFFNAVAMSDYSPIELVFGAIKKEFKKHCVTRS